MALVADYGSSDEEMEMEGEEEESVVAATPVAGPSKGTTKTSTFFDEPSEEEEEEDNSYMSSSSKLGQYLPRPRRMEEGEEEVGPIPPKKTYGDEEVQLPPPPPLRPTFALTSVGNISIKRDKGVIKIAAPSLKDFADNDAEVGSSRRVMDSSKKGSGLFAILPAPRGVDDESFTSFQKPKINGPAAENRAEASKASLPKSLIPDSVKNAQKRPNKNKLDEIRAKYLKKEMNVKIVRKGDRSALKGGRGSDNESENEDEEPTNFFSFESGANDADEGMLDSLKLPMPQPPEELPSSSYDRPSDEMTSGEDYTNSVTNSFEAIPEEDIMRFIQPKKGKSKVPVDLNIIDVKADDLRSDHTQWIKNLTDKSALPPRRAKGLGGVQKKKHQITYLAVEAVSRQEELEAQWAANAQNRRESRMKYGF